MLKFLQIRMLLRFSFYTYFLGLIHMRGFRMINHCDMWGNDQRYY